jgi:hypothetical protein
MSDSYAIGAVDAIFFGLHGSMPNAAIVGRRKAPHVSSSTSDDSATLSPTAQAKLWKQQGLSVAEIANQLGLPISTIQADLSVATSIAAA